MSLLAFSNGRRGTAPAVDEVCYCCIPVEYIYKRFYYIQDKYLCITNL